MEDLDVAAALRFIRSHAQSQISVSDVLRVVPVSRRRLEQRFRKAIESTVAQEIRRVHLERAKHLLAGTDLPIAVIAVQSGFSGPKHLCAVFSQEVGTTATEYRGRFHSAESVPL